MCNFYVTDSLTTVSPDAEIQLVVQALRLNTLSKLTFADSKRFDSLIKDMFPGVSFKSLQQEKLETALKEACCDLKLEVVEAQVRANVDHTFYMV